MTLFNNEILNTMYKNFLEKENKKNKEIRNINKFKYIPIANTFWMVNDDLYGDDNSEDNVCIFSLFNIGMFVSCYMTGLIIEKMSLNQEGNNYINYFFIGCFSLCCILIFISSILFSSEKIERVKLKTPLSKQDFKTIMSNFNNKIVEKVMKENHGELCYNDLKKIDNLVLKQNEELVKIEQAEIEEVWNEIDRETILKRFKGKSKEEIMEELKSIGFLVKNEENIIAERDFYKALKEENKEECVL